MAAPRRHVGRTWRGSINVTRPGGGASPKNHRVAATACRINTLARSPASRRNVELIHAPGHWCLVISTYGQDVTHSAASVFSTTHRPGGTNCGAPIVWRL